MYNPEHLELELKIDAAYRQLCKGRSRRNWQRLAELVKRRSPERIAEMEHERGLR